MKISVVIITKNEEQNIGRTLSRLSWCDDIVVLDDFSADETKKIAQEFGARLFERKFDGFGTQKQYAVSQAKHDWVLNIDADEVLSDALIAELKSLNTESSFTAYEIPIRHVFMGKEFKFGKESKFPHLRLFNKTFGNFNQAAVHEKVETNGKTGSLKNHILHYSYRDLEHYFRKFNSYTTAGAQMLKNKGKHKGLFLIIVSFPVYFIKHFVFYGNILNGRPGLIWSYLNAWYHTVKYLKLYELNHK